MMNIFYTYTYYFIIYAFLGWCTEVIYATTKTGKFVNRGFLNGPICPIYGFGVLLVLLLLSPLKQNLFILFAGSALLTTLLELVTGFVLEKLFHTSWWDYSSEPFNIKGYICLRFSLIWGVACLLVVNDVHKVIAHFVRFLPLFIGKIGLIIIVPIILADMIYTVSVILKFNKNLEHLEKLNKRLREASDELGEKISKGTLEAMEFKDEAKENIDEFKDNLDEFRDDIRDNLDEMKDDLDQFIAERSKKELERISHLKELEDEYFDALRMKRSDIRLLRAFPGIKSKENQGIVELLRRQIEK